MIGTIDAPPMATSGSFPSLDALREVHNALIQRYRENQRTPELLDAVTDFLQRGQATGAILDAEDDRRLAQSILDYWSALLYQPNRDALDATLADFDPLLAPEIPDDRCPYVGLDAFREVDQNRFFGRQRLIAEMIERLRDTKILSVVGPSGSGKSSLVRAGLIPALKAGALPGSADWRYFEPIVPGSDPIASLVRVTRPSTIDIERWSRNTQYFHEQPAYLARLIGFLSKTPVVITVDQFEEVFTLCTEEMRRAFVNNLLSLLSAPNTAHRLILTMRSDFEPFIQRSPTLQPLFEASRLQVTPLTAADLREAIESPASQIDLRFEGDLVERLLQDILGEPAGLPLLQFTLLKLWEHRHRNRVTLAEYERIGGGRLALARSADECYDDLILEERVTARRILLRMVRPGVGLEVTSNRIRRDVLFVGGEDPGRVERVLQKLIEARLVRQTEGDTPEDTQVEVAHEALVRNWPTLVDWLEQEREALRQRQRLADIAKRWSAAAHDPALLWRGALLKEALNYKDLNKIERDFVRAGLVAEARIAEEKERVEREREAGRQRELLQARELAEAQARRAEAESQRAEEQHKRFEVENRRASDQERAAGRLRRFLVALVIVSFIAIAAAVVAGIQQTILGTATKNAQVANTAAAAAMAAGGTAEANSVHAISLQATAEGLRMTAETQRANAQTTSVAAQATVANVDSLRQTAQAQLDAAKGTASNIEATAASVQAANQEAQTANAALQQTVQAAQSTATSLQQEAEEAQAQSIAARGTSEAAGTSVSLYKSEANTIRATATSVQSTSVAIQATSQIVGTALVTLKIWTPGPTFTPTTTPTSIR